MKRKIIEKLIPENKKQLFALYTVLFLITLIGSYFPFILLKRTLLWEMDDGILQHYEWLCYLKRAVHQFISGNGFSFWTWSSGLGADTIGSYGGILCDPFNYIAILFPESHIDIGYTLAVWLRVYVAGIGFLWFGTVTKLPYHLSLLGGLSYCFSAWIFHFTTTQSTFVMVAVVFVYLMVGVEKILRHESPLPFIVAGFFSAVTSVYFSFMSAVLIGIYLLIHVIKTKNEKNESLRFVVGLFGRFFLYAVIILLLSMIVVVPVLYTLTHAIKSGAAEYGIFHPIKIYMNYVTSIAAGNMIFMQGSTFGALSLFLILIPAIMSNIRHRKATAAMVMFLCCLIFLLFPVINSALNGMGYVSGRWCYIATFFFVWSGLQCLDKSVEQIVKLKKWIYGLLLFLGIWLVIICRVILRVQSEYLLVLGIINIAFGKIDNMK